MQKLISIIQECKISFKASRFLIAKILKNLDKSRHFFENLNFNFFGILKLLCENERRFIKMSYPRCLNLNLKEFKLIKVRYVNFVVEYNLVDHQPARILRYSIGKSASV